MSDDSNTPASLRSGSWTSSPDSLAIFTGTRSEAFNYAIALWAQQGTPDSSSFELVIQLDKDNGTANYAQCLAVALAVVGQAEGAEERLNQARSRLTSRPEPAFSCWQSPLSDGIPNASEAWSICVSAA
jgi:hypothetical protein